MKTRKKNVNSLKNMCNNRKIYKNPKQFAIFFNAFEKIG